MLITILIILTINVIRIYKYINFTYSLIIHFNPLQIMNPTFNFPTKQAKRNAKKNIGAVVQLCPLETCDTTSLLKYDGRLAVIALQYKGYILCRLIDENGNIDLKSQLLLAQNSDFFYYA